jgi:hypothetical protein
MPTLLKDKHALHSYTAAHAFFSQQLAAQAKINEN